MARKNKSREAYARVTAYKEKHPDATIGEICKKLGISGAAYGYGRTVAKREAAVQPKRTRRPRIKHEVLAVAQPQNAGKIPVILVTQEQLREMFQ